MSRRASVRGGHAWWGLCAAHAAASVWLWWSGPDSARAFVWHAQAWVLAPWTLWTSAWVHLSPAHLIGNLLALGGMAAAGWVLRPDTRYTVAWLLAWPLTQVSLLLWPTVTYAVGLSGLLHAAVLLLAVPLILGTAPVRGARFWGLFLVTGALTKVVLERGWSQPLADRADTGMVVVQAAHLAGAFWGLALGLCVAIWQRSDAKRPAEAGP